MQGKKKSGKKGRKGSGQTPKLTKIIGPVKSAGGKNAKIRFVEKPGGKGYNLNFYGSSKKYNTYLKQLINPEAVQAYRLPDAYARKTAASHLRAFFQPFYFPTGSVVEAPGAFYMVYRPSLAHPCWNLMVTPWQGVPRWQLSNPTRRFNITAIGAGALSAAEQDGQMYLPAGQPFNLIMPKFTSSVDYVEDPFFSIDSNGNEAYGYAFAAGSGTPTITVNLKINGSVANTDTVTFLVINPVTGLNVQTQQTLTNGTLQYAFTTGSIAGLLQSDATNGLGLCIGRPGLCFRLTFNQISSTTPGIFIDDIGLTLNVGTAPTNDIRMVPTDWPDMAELIEKATAYRTVGASLWTKYEGSTLNDGGSLACIMYRGGKHPNRAGLYNFQQISNADDSYEDKMKLGAYQFWMPASESDTIFRDTINDEEWFHPWFALAGTVGTLTQATPLRVEARLNIEFVTASQLFKVVGTRPDPAMIAAATQFLYNAPTSMSNENHLSTIWNWLKQATKDSLEFVHGNAGWIVPALGAAATML